MKRVDPELVEILVCPDTKLNVDLVPAETVDKINLNIKDCLLYTSDAADEE